MTVLLVLLLLLAVGVAAAVASGLVGGGLPEPARDVRPPLEHGVRAPSDLDDARFALGFRGYRMDQVDEVLDGARDALVARDREVSELREELAQLRETVTSSGSTTRVDPRADPGGDTRDTGDMRDTGAVGGA